MLIRDFFFLFFICSTYKYKFDITNWAKIGIFYDSKLEREKKKKIILDRIVDRINN